MRWYWPAALPDVCLTSTRHEVVKVAGFSMVFLWVFLCSHDIFNDYQTYQPLLQRPGMVLWSRKHTGPFPKTWSLSSLSRMNVPSPRNLCQGGAKKWFLHDFYCLFWDSHSSWHIVIFSCSETLAICNVLVLRCISACNAGESDCAVHSATTFCRQVGFVFVAWHLQTRLARLPRMWHLMEQGVEEDLLSDTSLLWTFLGPIKTYTPWNVCWPGDSFTQSQSETNRQTHLKHR